MFMQCVLLSYFVCLQFVQRDRRPIYCTDKLISPVQGGRICFADITSDINLLKLSHKLSKIHLFVEIVVLHFFVNLHILQYNKKGYKVLFENLRLVEKRSC